MHRAILLQLFRLFSLGGTMMAHPSLGVRLVSIIFIGWAVGTFQSLAHGQTLAACSASSSNATAKYGKFEKAIRVELLDNGRLVRLLESVQYVDPCGEHWVAPVGSIVDGASIPRVAWSIVGGPLEGRYRDASVIHDIACNSRSRPWKLVHEAFFFAMLARDTPRWQAKVMYAAVYHFGPRWLDPVTHAEPPKMELSEEDFVALADTIRQRESRIGAVELPPISLEEIEAWTPSSESTK